MYSMKRTSAETLRPYSIRSASSSSFTERITTVSTFVPPKPDVLLFRHAVGATQVASVGHRDPEIPERARERVLDSHRPAPLAAAATAPAALAAAAPAARASSARVRSHSRRRPAFLTPTSK